MICKHQNAKEFLRYDSIVLYQCQECGLVFIKEIEEKEDSKLLYENFYKNETGGRFNFGIEYMIRLFRSFRAFKIFSINPKAKSILDIGSGRGFMLYYLKKYYGYQTAIGTQLSMNAVEFSRKKLGLEIYDKDFLDLSLGDGRFDAVTMWHVLEHVSEPEQYIEKIWSVLKDRGTLIIEVPNLDSWTAGWTGFYWLGLDLKYHLYFFSPRSLSRLLQKYGFKIKNIHTYSLEYSTFISAQSILSLLTRSDHLVYEWIQTKKFRPILFLHLFLFIVLLPVCFVVNLLFFFSRRGEVLLIVAEKTAPAGSAENSAESQNV